MGNGIYGGPVRLIKSVNTTERPLTDQAPASSLPFAVVQTYRYPKSLGHAASSDRDAHCCNYSRSV
jgi:hypothetical protein